MESVVEIKFLFVVNVKILNGLVLVKLVMGVSLFFNVLGKVDVLVVELEGLIVYRMNGDVQCKEGMIIEFEVVVLVSLLVGYFCDDQKKYVKVSKLEMDVFVNDYGQVELKLINVICIVGMLLVNVYVYYFEVGKYILLLLKGYMMVLGFMDVQVILCNVGLVGVEEMMDWMFY